MPVEAIALRLTGRVQGVGFRPHVYRQAQRFQISGWVRNVVGKVEIHAEGDTAALKAFCEALISDAPPLSEPVLAESLAAICEGRQVFEILDSDAAGEAEIHVPPDQSVCADCRRELLDPADRRHGYPFINCTQCGPRYTIIENLPYDRASTSMAVFPMCGPCEGEYRDPASRRFHAEPNACEDCGPSLSYREGDLQVTGNTEAMAAAIKALQQGRILAVKGVGGYHLMCDAANDEAVLRLRRNKPRPHKPLALMLPEAGDDRLASVCELVELNDELASRLLHPSRPIILLPCRPDAPVSEAIAPGLGELGVMLPPSPFHLLLMQRFGRALVATSANISGEPVLTDDGDAVQRLSHIAEGWLQHDRLIVRPADDSVQRVIHAKPRMIRLGRGIAPVERELPFTLERPVLAVGGHMKNTVALAWQDRIVVSPHIGDLSARRSLQVFRQVIADLQRLYQVKAQVILCDQHTQYASTRWARQQTAEVVALQHHRAHASALAGEHQPAGNGLVYTWDGVGLGDDGTLWGGETFFGSPGHWRRVASFRPFRLCGGDKVSMQPWRSAASLHWQAGLSFRGGPDEAGLLQAVWRKGLNCFDGSAVGRLFDAAAWLVGVGDDISFDGQAPMQLEAIARRMPAIEGLPMVGEDGLLRCDWSPMLARLGDATVDQAERAGWFHAVMAGTIRDQFVQFSQRRIDQDRTIDWIGLCGGVFQNRLLTELVMQALRDTGLPVLLASAIPANDGGLSFGQVIEYGSRE